MRLTMRAWPVARSIFDAPYVREANERTTGWINVRRARKAMTVGCKPTISCRLCLMLSLSDLSDVLMSDPHSKRFKIAGGCARRTFPGVT